MGSMIENIGDFDGDGEITGKDLDIMWAYLQTKLLTELEWKENLEKPEQTDKCIDLPAKCSPVDADGNITEVLNNCGPQSDWNINNSHPGAGSGHPCPPCCQYLPTNFIEKMLELYESNQTAGIAEPNADMKLSDIPGTYEIGKPAGKPQYNILQYWTMNESPDAKDRDDNPHMSQGSVIESIHGVVEEQAVRGNVGRTDQNNKKKQIGFSDTSANIDLRENTLLPDTDWTLIIKCKLRPNVSGASIFEKSLMKLKTFGSSITLYDSQFENESQNNTNAIYFTAPDGFDPYNKNVTIYLNKKGSTVKLLIDAGEGPKLYGAALSSYHTNIGTTPKNLENPLTIMGESVSELEYVQIIDESLTVPQIEAFSPGYDIENYVFNDSLSLDDMKGQTTIGANNVPFSNSSYIGFTTQIIDKFGNSLKLFNNKNDNDLAPLYAVVHKHIFRADVGHNTGTANGFTTSGRETVLSLGKGADASWAPHPSARIENLSMVGNFTIAFWFRTSNVDNTNTFFRFEKTNVTATERGRGTKNRSMYLDLAVFNGGKSISSKLYLDGTTKWHGNAKSRFLDRTEKIDLESNWNHFVFVKNGGLIGLWINKEFKGYISLSRQVQTAFGRMNMVLLGAGNTYAESANNNNRFADLRVLGYAKSNIPANGFVTSNYEFIDKLQAG